MHLFQSYIGSPALLGLLDFSDWQLVQVLVKACHLVSSQAAHRHLQLVPVRDKDALSVPVGAFLSLTRSLGNCH